ncbi:hypothetical protein GCM10023205_11030 [Yinghuangia aomiensis]|uniref:Uncharacterized protein n=1 Tax=Yinghuangia aomiensis TaxID=676205 RepID=A0ABP9GS01_9ACTN
MTAIADLWARGQLPIRDGLYLADGRAYDFAVDAADPSGGRVGARFDLGVQLESSPEDVANILTTARSPLPDGGFLCVGEGSWGGEGFFGKLAADGGIVWLVYLEFANPFSEIEVRGSQAVFRSTSGVRISVAADAAPFGSEGA